MALSEQSIKTGIFDRKYSSLLQEGFEMRQDLGHEDFCVISKADLKNQVNNAKWFFGEIEHYLSMFI